MGVLVNSYRFVTGGGGGGGWTELQADTFDGTGAWSDGDWTQVAGTWERVSGQLKMTTVFNSNCRIHYGGTLNDDQAVEVRVFNDGITDYGRRLAIQATSTVFATGYQIVNAKVGAAPSIYRSSTWVAGTSTAIADGDLLRLEVLSGVVKFYINGSETGTYTDGSPLTGGAPGIWIDAGTSPTGYPFDDLTVEHYV